ncbi:hypothetical protein GQ44DRAFT_778467 [Phaeosphaeriaceae sp. PMI808]|nr:hypothetical protein GQ44DRAFT_778467 [Phaeosphaeriaceae sp. PMI808]
MSIDSGFQGNQFSPGTAAYARANNLYATSTYGEERDMNPGQILQPTSIEDIRNAINHANRHGKPVAIRSGGHQYSGACSTGPNGIQLDLKPTFRRPKLDLQLIRDTHNDKVYIRSSVSWTLSEFYDFLLDNGVFSVKNGRMDRPIQIQNATRTDSDGSLDLIHFDPWGRSRLKPLNI